MSKQTEIIKRRYNRIAPVFNTMDKMVRPSWRKEMLAKAEGEVLEVGIGTGANLPFYPSAVTYVTGIDFSSKMIKLAKEEAEKAPVPVKLMEMDAEKIDFPDASFDTVVTACVFCSVPDPVQGLKEIKRVLKPGGKVLMLEHMRSEHVVLGKLMDIINPIIVRMWGANINRKTIENIQAAGLKVKQEKQLMGSIVRELTLQ
ncbi:class I SAM-dependent methyltransferase [Domibacillus indicus]|uniref:class I SAM-dependent methyltransferase n=1 Tax=Domibacillus indicus TaxID=1437523 RepID=UPI00203D9790|nr:class I SAM-dependent methyltransferase [Domibacillus indicus]MCM3789001.1 class I SAM-dependent methyltransferase [Domibacillus indicus]